ncbi:DUF6894 family protein [Aureimonas pseudogalii]|uniref:DUF6894 domain-containing protein n=1 Tax=Aureimonas pseudogalii TaxID=1744844 RepID=A0A7W6H6G2_9HYPH|nr:hypothetical protein [Aureimonas pseudogalii]MBB3999416.1 hypothetical protein [Aureimonas pseudogalii]
MRYYFNQIKGDGVVLDHEGSEHPDLAAALTEAVDAAREIMAVAVRSGWDISHEAFEVLDETHQVLARVPFSTVLSQREPSTKL